MKNAALLFAAFPLWLFGQNPAPENPGAKAVRPLDAPSNVQRPASNVRAVVVGISDYQSPQILDLRFAHRDAEAFAEWLKSPAGGSVPAENIRLLLNDQAKNAQIVADLDGLAEDIQPGELAIIYFSGHGDVETKTRSQFGFLLAWDSPPTNYKAGAYPLIFLQDIISTISDKKARVLVVADACHAGKLAGSSVGGTQATAQTLAQQFANEVKIMSCQPNELALEGEQWGGGRGVFSYFLIDGLTGLADRNNDAAVNLFELDRFLGDVVPEQTAPHSQIPFVVGDKQTLLARVDAAALANLKNAPNRPGIAITGGKGLADAFLEDADSLTKTMYRRFENALASGNLLGGDSSADAVFQRLAQIEALRPIHNLMRRNLAAALQNEPQQALNALLADDPYEVNRWLYSPSKYAEYPRQLERAIEILGEQHYVVPSLKAKKLYFEGYLIAKALDAGNSTATFQDSVRHLAIAKWREAIAAEPQAAYLYYSIGKTYERASVISTDSLLYWFEKAIERSPTWLLPYLDAAYEFAFAQNDFKKAGEWTMKAVAIAPASYLVQERLSWLYQWQEQWDESLAVSEKMMADRPLYNAFSTAGMTCLLRGDYRRAESYFGKARSIEPSFDNWAASMMVALYLTTRRENEALTLFDSIQEHAETAVQKSITLNHFSWWHMYNRQFDKAEFWAKKTFEDNFLATNKASAESILGMAQILKGNHAEGRRLMKKACETEYTLLGWRIFLNQYEAIISEKEGRTAEADSFYRAACSDNIKPDLFTGQHLELARFDYFRFLLRQKREAEALSQIEKIAEMKPLSWRGPFCRALFEAHKGHQKAALDWLEKSLDRWVPTAEMILEEPLFSKIKKTKRFKALMLRHFPGG